MSTSKKQSLSAREKLLLPLALAIIFVVLYGAARLRPGLAQIKQLKQELSTAIQGQETLNWPSNSNSDTAVLRQEISQLSKTRLEEIARLSKNEATLADVTTSSELQSLRIQISALAREHEIRVIKNVPYDSDYDDSGVPSSLIRLSDAPLNPRRQQAPIIQEYFQLMYARPLQKLELSATYAALQQFIDSLAELEHRVNVVSFELKMDKNLDELAQPRLSSQLVIAL